MTLFISCFLVALILASGHSKQGFRSLLPLGKVTAPTTYSSLTIQVSEEVMEKQMIVQEETIRKGLKILARQDQSHKDSMHTAQLEQNLEDLMDRKLQTQAVFRLSSSQRKERDPLGWLLGGAALGLGVANEYQISQLQNRVTTQAVKIQNQEKKIEALSQQMDSMRFHEVRMQTLEAIRGYERVIAQFEDLVLGTLTGDIPLHTLHLPHLYKEIETIQQLSQESGLMTPPTQHILHLPKTVRMYKGGVDIILTIPQIARIYDLYKFLSIRIMVNQTAWHILPASPLVATTDKEMLDLNPTDLQACDHHKRVWYCPHLKISRNRSSRTCNAAIMNQDWNMTISMCSHLKNTENEANLLSPHHYWFDQPQPILRLSCINQSHYVYHNHPQEIEVPPGCEAITKSHRITELKTSSWIVQDTVDLIADDLVMSLSNEHINFEDTIAVHYQHAQTAAIFMCLLLVIIVILFLIIRANQLRSCPPECTDR